MHKRLTNINIRKLQQQLDRVRIACWAAIEMGDSRAVARLTCEAARLRDSITLAPSVRLGLA
ncbi:MAG: hypothetical protein U1G07_15345 [Verrucomicrobiota bacterium]